MNPYNLVVFDRPKNLNAESPSKNCVSGTTLVPASRLNHPLLGISLLQKSFRRQTRTGNIKEEIVPLRVEAL